MIVIVDRSGFNDRHRYVDFILLIFAADVFEAFVMISDLIQSLGILDHKDHPIVLQGFCSGSRGYSGWNIELRNGD